MNSVFYSIIILVIAAGMIVYSIVKAKKRAGNLTIILKGENFNNKRKSFVAKKCLNRNSITIHSY